MKNSHKSVSCHKSSVSVSEWQVVPLVVHAPVESPAHSPRSLVLKCIGINDVHEGYGHSLGLVVDDGEERLQPADVYLTVTI